MKKVDRRIWPIRGGAILIGLLLLSGFVCRQNAYRERIIPATEPRSAAALKGYLMLSPQPPVRTFWGYARLQIEGDEVGAEVGAHFVLVRDSILGVVVKKLGMEVARILVTADSFFLLNRVEKTVYAVAQGEFLRRYSLVEGLSLLQCLLLGRAWLPSTVEFQAGIKDSLHQLSGTDGRFLIDYRVEERTFWPRQSLFSQPSEGQWLLQTCAQFRKLPRSDVFFPYFRRIELFSAQSGYLRLEIDFIQIEINVDKSFRFEIPEHYLRLSE